MALEWFLQVFKKDLCQERLLAKKTSEPLHLYCDVRGELARIAAVLLEYKFQEAVSHVAWRLVHCAQEGPQPGVLRHGPQGGAPQQLDCQER